MSIIVKCHLNVGVQLPEGKTGAKGNKIPCPQGCPRKRINCARIQEFEIKEVGEFSDSNAVRYTVYKYSQEELTTKWNLSNNEPARSTIQPIAQESLTQTTSNPEPINQAYQTPVNQATINQEPIMNNWGGNGFASAMGGQTNFSASTNDTRSKYQNLFGTMGQSTATRREEYLEAEREYNRIMIGGVVFTNDQQLRNQMRGQPLLNAVDHIFYHWNLRAVFEDMYKANKLKDEFCWLLVKTADSLSGRIKKADVDDILNRDCTPSQKFFYLFYDVIYRRQEIRGFYWSDRPTISSLRAYFTNKKDFLNLYCDEKQGEAFRAFFRICKSEIMHYLKCEDEDRLFEEATLEMAKTKGQILFVDYENEYKPLSLGRVEDFVARMKKPSDFIVMGEMVSFLRRFEILSTYEVVVRERLNPLSETFNEDVELEDSIYKALGLEASGRYATQYKYYKILLKEYTKVFRPTTIEIGHLRFSQNQYSQEIEKIVGKYCEMCFDLGDVPETEFQTCKGNAWLAKNLYEQKILSNYVCENQGTINQLMELVKNPTREAYFKLYNNPMFRKGRESVTIHDYLQQIMYKIDAYEISRQLLEDPNAKEFFKVKALGFQEDHFYDLFKEYEDMYNQWKTQG